MTQRARPSRRGSLFSPPVGFDLLDAGANLLIVSAGGGILLLCVVRGDHAAGDDGGTDNGERGADDSPAIVDREMPMTPMARTNSAMVRRESPPVPET